MPTMLSWIPLLGPILQGISSIFTSFSSEKIAQINANSANTIAETQASVQIIQATQDDIGLRIMRDAACLPVVVWTMLLGWDTIIARTNFKSWMWHTADYPESVKYIPYAVLIFLFGNLGLNAWKNK